MKIIWSTPALQDMLEMQAYMEERNPSAAWRMADGITKAVESLRLFPNMGRMGRVDGTRELGIAGIPYIAIYEAGSEYIGILRIMHTSRLWPPEKQEFVEEKE